MNYLLRNLFLLIFFVPLISEAQYFLGLRTSQYGGVTNVGFNPAIAGDRHRIDINIIGIGASINNNYVGVDRSIILKPSSINKDVDFQNTYLRERLDGKNKRAYVGLQVQGPLSFMFTFGKKHEEHKNAIAVTWNVNTVTNVNNVSQKLARIAYYGAGFTADSIDKFDYVRIKEKDASLQHMTWVDYGITYSRAVYDKGDHYLKVGGTLKIIQGLFSVNAYIRNAEFRYQNYDTISIYNSSGILDVNSLAPTTKEFNEANQTGDIAKYVMKDLFSVKDGGISAAADIAAVYEWRPNKDKHQYEMDGRKWYHVDRSIYTLQAGFSMTDLGAVRFKRSEYSYEFGADKQDWYVKEFKVNDGIQSFGDTIRATPGFTIRPTKGSYTIFLPTRINLWVDYNPFHFFGVSALATIAPRMNKERSVHHISTFTLTPHLDWKYFGLYLPLSYDVLNNFNFGATARIGPIIIGTQDLLGFFAKKNVYNADVHIAVKIPILARKQKDRDRDFVSNKEDKCKKEKGSWVAKGCPDRDGDGVLDIEDKCPDVPGPRETQGCPDRDGDGVLDMNDSCPDIKGLVELFGCPDADGDGIADKDDECPEQAGSKDLKGCPDRDGDGVADKNDDCVDVPGDKAHKGCPDSDGDGLYDNEDACPREAGPIENKGCPYKDTDGDGVLDKDDDCPNTFGAKDNRGCPKLAKKELEVIKYAFENLEFETGKDIIKKTSFISLNGLAKLLSEKALYGLKIEGHTDDVGDDNSNLILSQKRADAVKRYLIGKGVDGAKLETAGFGESKPIADNKTPIGRQKNRRVEMAITFR